MLFLLNDRVLDLGDPAETLLALGAGDPARLPPTRAIVAMGQEAAFASGDFAHGHRDLLRSLACLTTLALQANCALFVTPANAKSARQVGVQFAFAPLTTLAYLEGAQAAGRLGPALANRHVWRLAGRAGAA